MQVVVEGFGKFIHQDMLWQQIKRKEKKLSSLKKKLTTLKTVWNTHTSKQGNILTEDKVYQITPPTRSGIVHKKIITKKIQGNRVNSKVVGNERWKWHTMFPTNVNPQNEEHFDQIIRMKKDGLRRQNFL